MVGAVVEVAVGFVVCVPVGAVVGVFGAAIGGVSLGVTVVVVGVVADC